jgi:N-methylhydantoinase B
MTGINSGDLVTREVIGGYLVAAAEEMHATLIRTAYSLNVKERADCSSSVLDAAGQVVSIGADAPLHFGSMLGLVEAILSTRSLDDVRPGDVFMTNDPYQGGGSHLPDITVASPVFVGDRLLAFVANIAHHADLGGASPGGIAMEHSDIFQEGLRLPVMKLVEEGVLRRDVVELVALNSRSAGDREGDLRAQLASLEVGSRRLTALVDTYGADEVERSVRELTDYSERRFRNRLRSLPHGVYEAEDFLDADAILPEPVPLRVRIESSPDKLKLDFSESGDQVPAARNVPRNALLATVYAVVKQIIDPGLPANAGYFRAIEVVSRPGSIVDPVLPAAVGDRALTCNILGDAIVSALAEIVPDNAMAGSGAYVMSVVSGSDPVTARPFVNFEAFAGSMGAAVDRDGLDAVRVHASGGANQSVEAMELAFPVEVGCYELMEDTGGVGRFQGGLATRRDIRVYSDDARLTVSGGRMSIPPPGAAGGGAGVCGRVILNPGTDRELDVSGSTSRLPLPSGDVLRVETASAGGYGDPEERDRSLVLRDVRQGRISADRAQAVYGVTADPQPDRDERSPAAGVAAGDRA